MGGDSEDQKFLLDPGVQLERGRALLDDPGDVRVDDIRDMSACRSQGKARLDAEREAELADQKRIADAERQAREAADYKRRKRSQGPGRGGRSGKRSCRQVSQQAERRQGQAREADGAVLQARARAEAERQAKEAAEQTADEAEKGGGRRKMDRPGRRCRTSHSLTGGGSGNLAILQCECGFA